MNIWEKMTKEQYLDMCHIVGAAMEVYNTLGRGMEEPIYQEALQMELESLGIKSHREVWFDMYYKNQKMKKRYKADPKTIELQGLHRRNRPINFLSIYQ